MAAHRQTETERLQGIIDTARKERDEIKEQYEKLLLLSNKITQDVKDALKESLTDLGINEGSKRTISNKIDQIIEGLKKPYPTENIS